MGDGSKIEWTDATWNPIVGCSRVSPGCDHCYAIGVVHRQMAPQHVGLTVHPEGERVDWTGEVRVVEHLMDQPLRWQRPRRVFVNSLSDLFHPEVERDTVARIFATMMCAERHTFQVLTKRPQRMAELLSDPTFRHEVRDEAIVHYRGQRASLRPSWWSAAETPWPLPNVWLGVSIESNRYAWRANHLRETQAAVRWVSAEPLLGPLDQLDLTGIDWLVAGGESGPGARPMHPEWVRSLRDRCTVCRAVTAGTSMGGSPVHASERGPAFHFKQWGDWSPAEDDSVPYGEFHVDDGEWISDCLCADGDEAMYRVGKKAAGRTLDGRTWDEYPACSSSWSGAASTTSRPRPRSCDRGGSPSGSAAATTADDPTGATDRPVGSSP